MSVDLTDPTAVRREAERRRTLREQGARSFETVPAGDIPKRTPGPDASRVIDPLEAHLDEKSIESLCDQLVSKLGAKVIRFSHPGKTKQTPGIADRLYCFVAHDRDHRIALWWEVKTPDGEQRPGQVVFQETVTACDQFYGVGGLGDLKAWLVAHGLASGFEVDGAPIAEYLLISLLDA